MLGSSSSSGGLRGDRGEENIPAAITDVGCERDINEDRYAVIDSPAGRAWIVCDGMGGTMGGELAAQLAIDAVRRGLESRSFESTVEALQSAVEEANRVIVLRRQNPAFSSMGTTVVGALIQGDEVALAHAGDSRAYLVRDGAIQQLTVDHTYVQDLVDRGAINEEDALSHPQAHVLTKCLGAAPRLDLDTQTFWIWPAANGEPEDKLILCSDGLYSLVEDYEMAEIFTTHSPQEACVKLVEMAKERGGYDNITLAVLPLGGQMREESPEHPYRPAKVQQREATVSPLATFGASLSLGKRLALMFLLALVGSIGTVLTTLIDMR
ncbi:MAG: serine/threonine-protein phosphatase [Bdellovibrionales bacterium]|nr:serine/threonine-protein phosphatase [Bdellovibrionales bacterium]